MQILTPVIHFSKYTAGKLILVSMIGDHKGAGFDSKVCKRSKREQVPLDNKRTGAVLQKHRLTAFVNYSEQ